MFPCCGTLLAFLGVFHLQPVQPAEQPAQHCLPELSKDEFKFSGDGYLQLPNKKAGQRNFTDLRFTFRTLTDEGLLLLTINPQLTAYKSLKLVHGKLVYQYDLGSGHSSMVVLSDIRFDDGKWHVMEARQFNDKDIVLIDGKLVSSVEIPESVRDSFTEILVYVGGVEAANVIKDAVKNFTGSVKDIRHGNTKIDHHLAFKRQNVLSGCNKRLRRETGNKRDFRFNGTYIGATNLELSWNPIQCYSSFNIQWKEGEEDNKTRNISTTELRTEIKNLKADTKYAFTIFGYSDGKIEQEEINITTASSDQKSLVLDNVTENTISLSWNAESFPSDITYQTLINGTYIGNVVDTSYTFENLMPGKIYKLELTGLNHSFSASRIIRTRTSVVTNFACTTGNTAGQINCSWASDFERHCLSVEALPLPGSDDDESDLKHHVRKLNLLDSVLKNLRPGERYRMSVYGYKNDIDVIAKPGIAPDFKVNALNDSIIVPFFNDRDRTVEYYNVTLENFTHSGNGTEMLSQKTEPIKFEGLTAGHFYVLHVHAMSHGEVSETISSSVCTVPNDPSSINCDDLTSDSFIINIKAPNMGYVDYYSASVSEIEWMDLRTVDSVMHIKVTELKPYHNYNVTVKTVVNNCDKQSHGKRTLCRTKEGVPGNIKGLHNTSFETSALNLKWSLPDQRNGILRGIVIKIEGEKFDLDCNRSERWCHTSYHYHGLESGKCYVVEVAASTSAGTGPFVSKRICTKESKTEPLVIVAGILLPVLIIVLIVLLVLYFLQRNPRQAQSVRHLSHRLRERASEMLMFKQPTVFSKPVKISDFVEYVTGLEKDSGLKFTEEYEELKFVGRNQSKDEAELQCNRVKNRFTNILPYDISRVKLLAMEDVEGSDYINASWIPGFHSKREFIASQGPLPSTIDDFWRMVWENNCPAIVMLTQCIEKGHIKCEQYWPLDTDPVFYGDVKVELQNADKNDDRHIRYFKISLGAQTRDLVHFHYIGWPDMYVPDRGSLIMFVREVRKLICGHGGKGPVVVHCSAGVGRTGTFIALDTHMHQIEVDHDLDVYGVVLQMRMSRVLMVQTEAQYVFIYECLRHILEEKMGKVPEIKTASDGDGKDNESKDKTSQPATEVKSGSLAEEKTSIEEPKVEAAIVETSFSSPAETKTSGSENNSANNEEQNQKSNSSGDSAKVESEPKS